ncbi:MAG TPA: C-terminal binding protein [Chloroflexota bacterium]|nr:C-terminal binding protein [Chloroflexota bacterium]
MPDLQLRPDLWRRPATRIAAAGGPNWRIADVTLDALHGAPVDITQRLLREPDGSVAADIADSDILVTGMAAIDDALLDQLRNVRFLLRPYVGYDDIDVDALTRHGIVFANVPDAFIEEVANHALALILALNRRLLESDTFVKSGRWAAGERNRADVIPIRRTSVETLGLVGFGNIARLVVERARPFGFRLIAADPYVPAEVAEAMGVEIMPIDELMAQSDIVSLHCFLNAETRGMIDARRLALMKPGAYLVNTARGPIVDEPALVAALKAGQIAGAGLDVFQVEPLSAQSELLRMPNVLLSPHTASYSEEGEIRHHQRTAEIIRQVVDGALPERKVVVNKALYDRLAEELRTARV